MKYKKGFTLIELMLAIVIGSIVMMAVATPMVSAMRSQIRIQKTGELQSNIKIARFILQKHVRRSINEQVSNTKDELLLTHRDGSQSRFYKSLDNSLRFDPSYTGNGTASADEWVVIDEIASFAPEIYTNNGIEYVSVAVRAINSTLGLSVYSEIISTERRNYL